jgi:hypothetical protein
MTAIPKQTFAVPQPRLSDRNAARFMRLAAPKQMRFLHDLKYPKGSPQTFKQPFYAPAISGIRETIKRGFPGLVDARAKLSSVTQEARRNNLMRVLDAFANSPHAKRRLALTTAHRYHASIRNLELRLSPHVVAIEDNESRYIYFHEKRMECDPEEARLTLEFSHWILQQNGIDVSPHQLELIDLFSGKLYKGREPRAETISTLKELARLIESLWPTIDP